jgi:hypothetical protein
MNLAKNIFLFLLIASLLFTISCSESECEKALDCEQKDCFIASCDNGECKYSAKMNCCGNMLKEDIEDGKPGNKCTCPEDYGECDKKIGEYLQEYCDGNKCVAGVPENVIKTKTVSDDKGSTLFDLNLLTEYDEPFVIGTSQIKVTIEMTDDHDDLKPPVVIKRLRLFGKNDLLLGEFDNNLLLYRVGDKVYAPIEFDFDMGEAEEERDVELKVDYEYNKPKRVRGDDGEYYYEDTIYRKDFTISYRDDFVLVNPSMVENE